ncbi:DNA topoisomerase I [Candidatus Marsarchaeota archaeon]|nr:DNA topoisomerase I [Candidatus Marsarchaeota archaeon]MCL5092727.1 DNA topoisomerase I [Candidatus Marsarchaeota archaeon]
MGILIIAEKPSVALRIAISLGDGKQKKVSKGRTSYYTFEKGGKKLYVAAAVGHLFTLKQTSKEYKYPVFEIDWAPSYSVGKNSLYTKEYLDMLIDVSKECDSFINACDFDIEGTVIGTNIIKELTKKSVKDLAKTSLRMKYSTTTTKDLQESYASLMPLDVNNFYAGETRHKLDWLWGINFSRALTSAIGYSVARAPLSIGRVQGPTLAMLSKREIEIGEFKPRPFWRVNAMLRGVEFSNSRGDMFEKELAADAYAETEKNNDKMHVDDIEVNEEYKRPPPPFDLTTLQLEASRALHMDPSLTLSLAQSLYERSYISYPRTSSQKLPQSLGLPKIIEDISRNPDYKDLASMLLKERRFKPVEGKKDDEAHPSIFPTGEMPKALSQQEARLYDLIARRFLSCFAPDAKMSRMKVIVSAGAEKYSASGMHIMESGWLGYYKYARLEDKTLPEFMKGESLKAEAIELKPLETQPPRRYTKAGVISELEKRGLGTKATRANIIDTLFKRNYIEGASIKVTNFGLSVYNALSRNCSMIIDETTTRKLEDDMELISKGKKTEQEVISEGKAMLVEALGIFDKNKDEIGKEMKVSFTQTAILGICPKDGGNLIIRKSRFGKQFVACSNYPKCTNTYSLPQNAKIEPTGRVCEYCKTPVIKVIRRAKRPFEMDLDPNCITKEAMKKAIEQRNIARAAKEGSVKSVHEENTVEIKPVKPVQEGKDGSKRRASQKPKAKPKKSKKAHAKGSGIKKQKVKR